MNRVPRPTQLPSAPRRRARIALPLLLLGAAAAHGETRCVANLGQLYDAFHDAMTSVEGTRWDIQIRQGTYVLTQSLEMATYKENDNKELYVSGGWTGANGTCDSQVLDASNTVIQGKVETPGDNGIGHSIYGDNKRYDFRWLRFQDFTFFGVEDHECMSPDICPDTDAIVFEHVEFDNGGIIRFNVDDAARLVFRNNAVTHMHPISPFDNTVYQAPFGVILDNDGSADISFNTFASITCEGTPGGVMIENHVDDVVLHHNIFQTTGCSKDLYVTPDGGHSITPISNLYNGMGGLIAGNLLSNGNVQNFNPLFTDITIPGDYHLQLASPAVNAGQTQVDALLSGLFAPSLDADGHLRLVGTRYDMGAYESVKNDGAPQVLKVTTISDDPDDTGSLRHAVNQANQQVGIAQKIVFDISGSCPHVILLASTLEITDSLYIDGYSQPGAVPNDMDVGNDASICILVGPGASGVNTAFEVPTGADDGVHFGISGIAFGSNFFQFTSSAIQLRAGSNHVVSGNAFGGTGPGDAGVLGGMARAVLLTGTATDSTIGGDENSARNTIGAMSQNAIVITGTTSGHTISNNYIGLTTNGIGAEPNSAEGISATGGHDITIKNNAIAASVEGIVLSGSATKNFTLTGNRIGVNAYGVGLAQHANDVGIYVGGGSSDHVIGGPPVQNIKTGAYQPLGLANDIRNNSVAGIHLPSAGAFVTMRGNRIEQNGAGNGGLGIDLGALGPEGNDAGDGDTGPNNLQNHPVITGTTAGATTLTVNARLTTNPNQNVRVDLYRSPTCPDGRAAANATTYLGAVDINSGSGNAVPFTAPVAKFAGAPGYLTATATTSTGNTSELAYCVREDTIFVDTLE